MSAPASGSADQSVGALLHELVQGTSLLLRQEWRLARLELEELAKAIGMGTVQIGVAGVCFALGGASLLASAALGFGGAWVRDHLAIVLAAGVVVLGGVGALLVTAGLRTLVRGATNSDDNSTEDDAWRNRRRMSAATSS
jgi:hypothetical protein